MRLTQTSRTSVEFHSIMREKHTKRGSPAEEAAISSTSVRRRAHRAARAGLVAWQATLGDIQAAADHP
jgi:hypothetical protein